MAARSISNNDDVIDSRDVIERIEELEDYRDSFVLEITEIEDNADINEPQADYEAALQKAKDDLQEFDESDEGHELKILKALADEAESSPDWTYGETLIRDSYFTDYARELAEDIGAVSREDQWPKNCIDWEYAAEQLKQDYMSVDFDGVEYWIRA